MLLMLQRYSLELQFVSGKDNVMADALSRFYLDCKDIDISKDMKIFKIIEKINPLSNLPITDNCIQEIEDATSKDHNLLALKKFILHKWPKYIRDVPDAIKQYHNYKSELTTYDGLILKNQAILIPENFREIMLSKLHKAHSGVENTLKLARDAIFWPSMSNDIREMIKNCPVCIKYQPSQQKFTMQSHKIPEYPFQVISMDVFFFNQNGKQIKYLITVDHYSDFFEIDVLKDLSSKQVIEICKKNFSRHGIPEIVVTDGGTNFVSQEFSDFACKWNFTQVTSSPHHPQGNGKAEATVKIAKKILLKATDEGGDIWLSLLCLRNTPNKLDSSPVQRLFSRRTRGFLPTIKSLLKPKVVENVSENIKNNKERIKYMHDKRSKRATTLEIGQPVSVQIHPASNKTWTPGIIADVLSDRSYLVDVNDTTYRRDLIHIRPLSSDLTDVPVTQHVTDMTPKHSVDMEQEQNETLPNSQQEPGTSEPCTTQPCNFPIDLNENLLEDPQTQNYQSTTKTPSFSKSPSTLTNDNKNNRPRRDIKAPKYLKDYVC